MTFDAFLNSPGADDPFLLAGLEAHETSHWNPLISQWIWWLWQPSFTGGWTCRVSQNPAGNMHWTDWLTCRFNMVLECRWQTLGTEALWVGYSFCDFGLLCQFGIFWSRPIGFSTFFSLKVSSEWMCVVQSEREPLALRPRVIDNNRQTIKWQLF